MIDPQELAGLMATWLATNPHSRPFFRDSQFVREFGKTTRAQLTAAADELWRRAEHAARQARITVDLPSRLGSSHERT